MPKKTDLIYKSIPDYPDYFACSNGKIYSSKRMNSTDGTNNRRYKELTAYIQPGSKYLSVNIVKDKTKISINVHKIVGWAFTGCDPYKYRYTHKRKNYLDNTPYNLECHELEITDENENRMKEIELKEHEALFRRNINYDYRCKIWKEYEVLKLKNNIKLLNNFLKIFLKVKKII
jgi:hypothetical protein